MSYGIVRVQKFGSGSVKGIEIHDKRDKDHSHTNPDIDRDKSEENYDLSTNTGTYQQKIKARIQQLQLKKAVRKDAVVMAQVLVTSDRTFFDRLSKEQTKEFFKESFEFLQKRYGSENVVSATVHMDEKTPHMHFNFVPVTQDGRLSAKTILNRTDIIRQHDDFYKEIGLKCGLERGVKGGKTKHLEVADYKLKTKRDEIEVLDTQKTALNHEINDLQATLRRLDDITAEFEKIKHVQPKKTLLGKIKVPKDDFDFLMDLAHKSAIQANDIKILEIEKDLLTDENIVFRNKVNDLQQSIYKQHEQNVQLGHKLKSERKKHKEELSIIGRASEFRLQFIKEKSLYSEYKNAVDKHNEAIERKREQEKTAPQPEKAPENEAPAKTKKSKGQVR